MLKLHGSMTALATPFKGGRLDTESYARLVSWQIKEGTAGLIPMGTTGESVTCTPEERKQAIATCVTAAGGKVPVIAGTGSNSTQDTILSTAAAREVGADAALVVTPYYNKPTQAGLVAHYHAIAKAHPGFPLVAYNVPGRTGVDLAPETVRRLCDIEEVVAIKEATGNMQRALDILELCGERLTLLSGDDFTVAPFLACGGQGVISVSSNVVPRLMADLVAAGVQGQVAQARAIQLKLQALHRALFLESNPIPVKRALHLMGLFADELRLPLVPMSPTHTEALGAALTSLGIRLQP